MNKFKVFKVCQEQQKRKALTKEHNRLNKWFIKLKEKFKLLQAVEVFFFSFTISFKFPKCMKFYR